MEAIPSILIVEASASERAAMAAALRRAGHRVVTAACAAAGLAQLARVPCDLLVAGTCPPTTDALALLGLAADRAPQLIAIVLAAAGAMREAALATRLGAADCLVKPVSPAQLLAAVDAALAHGPCLRREVPASSAPLLQTVHALVRAAELRDRYTAGHSARVARYAVALGRSAGLHAPEVENLRMAALLHDVGKVGISDLILNKPGPLTPGEWATIREHPAMGCRIVQTVEALAPTLPLILHHQESYDGTGYPAHLAGTDIPFGARILAVADAFEALTADRAYRPGRPLAAALDTLAAGAGRQWDPDVVGRWQRIAAHAQA